MGWTLILRVTLNLRVSELECGVYRWLRSWPPGLRSWLCVEDTDVLPLSLRQHWRPRR